MPNYISIVDEDERFPINLNDSTLHCRRYSLAVHQRLEKEVGKKRRNRQGEWYLDIDDHKMNTAALDYLVPEWEHVKDKAGQDVPCIKENKRRLPLDVITQVMEETGAASIMEGRDQGPLPETSVDLSSGED